MAQAGNTVTLRPEDDIQAAIDVNPDGTIFLLTRGLYRQSELTPKDFQQFIGEDGVMLNGAEILTGWRNDGTVWAIDDLPDPLWHHGETEDGTELAQFREDLFIDGQLYQRVGSMGELGPGKWYFEDNTGYISDNPTGKVAELSVGDHAFGGSSQGVVIKNLTVEKYATLAQHGAIAGNDTRDWQVINVDAQWNHGAGLRLGEGMQVIGGSYNHNGQLGIGGYITGSDGATVDTVEIAYNNYAGFSAGWEAGGIKILQNSDFTIRNSDIHDNHGPGIWADTDVYNILIEGNAVHHNDSEGIIYEASFDGIVRNNRVVENSQDVDDGWFWGSNILIQNSSNVHVHDNTVVVSADRGDGIGLINSGEARGGSYGPAVTDGVVVEHNTVIHLGTNGMNGMATDDAHRRAYPDLQEHNVFRDNTYVVPYDDRNHAYWQFEGGAWDLNSSENCPDMNATYIATGDPASYVPDGVPGDGEPGPVTEPFTVTVTVSGDRYRGEPQMQVDIDDQRVSDTKVTAQHSKGEWQDFTFTLDGVSHADTVKVAFVNDAYGGSAGKDRNLWVQSIEVNHDTLAPQTALYDRTHGSDLPGRPDLLWTGALIFDVSGHPASDLLLH